jgi:16S rRNA (cytidine1402-2'-O)-methyltransferase
MSDSPDESEKVNAGRTAERAAFELTRLLARPLAPGLYVVSTPIGNLTDISLRALATLAQADVVYCEDTRHSRTLLAHYSIPTRLRPYHEHNAEEERPRVLSALAEGRTVALISDAGTPLVSDPGYKLVREAAAAGHAVTAVPGASATLAALTVAGLPTDAFFFAGFLPAKEAARKSRIADLAAVPATLVFFEAANRAAATLADLADVLGPREAVLARELTKLHEEVRRGPLAEIAEAAVREPPKGEVVLLVAPPVSGATAVSDDLIAERLTLALENLSLRDATRAVADSLKVTKSRVYDIALGLKRHAES